MCHFVVALHILCTERQSFVCINSLLSLAASYEDFTVTADPESGSVITAFEYQNHIVIQCRISEGGNLVNTVWTASDQEGMYS